MDQVVRDHRLNEALHASQANATGLSAAINRRHRVVQRPALRDNQEWLGRHEELKGQASDEYSPEECAVFVNFHECYECREVGSRLGRVVAVPLEVPAHPVELPHALGADEAEAGDAHACVVSYAVPRRP